MSEKWIEEIKRNDEMAMLDRYFPGESCGNTECERHCIELCKIAERMVGMKKDEIVPAVAQLLVYPENCPALKSGQNHESCRFLLFSYGRISAYDDRTDRRIIGKKYISDADASKSGACRKCLEYANRIFKWPEEADKMPKLPLHPNCKCHYEDVYEFPANNSQISTISPVKEYCIHCLRQIHMAGIEMVSPSMAGSISVQVAVLTYRKMTLYYEHTCRRFIRHSCFYMSNMTRNK